MSIDIDYLLVKKNMIINRNEPFLYCSSESRSAEKPLQEQPQKVLRNKFITISYVTIHCLKLTILLWFTRSHGFLSNFSEQKQSQEFLFLVDFSQSVFNKKLCNPHVYVSVVMSALRLKSGMVWRQSATIEGLSPLHFLMVLHFSVSFCDEYFQFGASLDKIHKINRCRALSVMRSDAELLSGPAEWHYAAPVACSAAVRSLTIWIREGESFSYLEPGASLTDIMRRQRNGGAKFPGCCIQQFGANILLKVKTFLYFKSKIYSVFEKNDQIPNITIWMLLFEEFK